VTRRFGLSEFESSVVDYRARNDSSNLIKTASVLPIVKRGFTDTNQTITESRTRLTIENVSDLTSINGPPVEDYSPQPYVKVWPRDEAITAACTTASQSSPGALVVKEGGCSWYRDVHYSVFRRPAKAKLSDRRPQRAHITTIKQRTYGPDGKRRSPDVIDRRTVVFVTRHVSADTVRRLRRIYYD